MTVSHITLIADNEAAALRTLTEALQSTPDVLKIVLFGSRVRGDFRGSSDMDVLIVLRTMNIELKNTVIRILHNAELDYDVPISPVLYTQHEYDVNRALRSTFVEHVENEGIVLHDAEPTRKG